MRPRGHGKIGAPRQVHNVSCAPGAGRDQPTAPRQSRADDPRFGMMPFPPEARAKPETFHRMYGCHSGTHSAAQSDGGHQAMFAYRRENRTNQKNRLPRGDHKAHFHLQRNAVSAGTCIALVIGARPFALRKQQRKKSQTGCVARCGFVWGFFF